MTARGSVARTAALSPGRAASGRSCPAQRGRPASSSSVGATSARTPSRSARPVDGAADEHERHRVQRVGGDRVAVGVAHRVGVAVVGGDREQRARAVGSPASTAVERGDDPAEAARRSSSSAATVASQTPVWPTMSGFAKFATMKSYASDADRLDERVGDAGGAHLGLRGRRSRPSGSGSRRRSSPGNGASRPPLKKYVTWAYFSVSATWNWRQPASRERLRQRAGAPRAGTRPRPAGPPRTRSSSRRAGRRGRAAGRRRPVEAVEACRRRARGSAGAPDRRGSWRG